MPNHVKNGFNKKSELIFFYKNEQFKKKNAETQDLVNIVSFQDHFIFNITLIGGTTRPKKFKIAVISETLRKHHELLTFFCSPRGPTPPPFGLIGRYIDTSI